MTFRTKLGGSSIALLMTSGLLLNCVGDDPSAAPTTTSDQDSGGDSTTATDGNTVGDSNILPTDAGADTGPGCVAPTSATPGALDQTFGSTFHAIAYSFVPEAFAIDATGRSYVAGQAVNCVSGSSSYDYAVIRLTNEGDLDTTFNPGGKPVCFDFGTTGEVAEAIAIDSDGKIVIGGLGGNAGAFVAGVVRFDSTGALDTTFNTTGKLAGIYGGVGHGAGYFLTVNGIAFGPGNKIVLAGADGNAPNALTAAFLVRLTHDGSLDTGFAGGTGIYKDTTNVGGFYHLVVDATSGAVTAVGSYGSHDANLDQVGAVVERLTGAGVLDSTFASGGIYAPGPLTGSGEDVVHDIELTPSGEFAVAGAFGTTTGVYGVPGMVMLDNTGKPDSTFGTGGVFTAPASLTYDSLDLEVPLLPLCGGDFFYASRYNLADGGGPDIGLVHVLKTGKLDTGFGTAGIGHGMQQVVNVVAIARDPISQQPLVMATNGSNQVGLFRFDL